MSCPKSRRPVAYGRVDHGWAWVVLAGTVFWNSLFAGTLKSFGVIYLEFLELYGRGPAATAWLGFSFSFLTTILAPLSGYIGDQTSLPNQRILVMCLSVVMTLGVVLTGTMPTLEGAICTYGIAGISVALIDTPILSLIGKYFRRRRFLASCLTSAGSSCATLIIPPLITCLVQHYTIHGAMIIFGGIWLNVFVVGAIIWPLAPSTAAGSDSLEACDEESDQEVEKSVVKIIENSSGVKVTSKDACVNGNKLQTKVVKDQCQVKSLESLSGPEVKPEDNKKALSENHNVDAPSLCNGTSSGNATAIKSCRSVPSSPHTRPNHDHVFLSLQGLNGACITKGLNSGNNNNNNTMSDNCMMNGNEHHYTPVEKLEKPTTMSSNSTIANRCSNCPSICQRVKAMVLDYWNFLRSPGLPLMIASFFVASFAYFNQFFLFPPLGQEIGMTKMQGALLVSIPNCMEIISRIIVGILVDKRLIEKNLLVKVSFVCASVSCFTVTFFPLPMVMFFYAGLYGLVGGIFVPLCMPLMIQLVEDRYISSATSIYVVICGSAMSLGPPIFGAVAEASGSYVSCLRVCSLGYVVAIILYCLQNGNHTRCMKGQRRRKSPRQTVVVVDA